VLKLTEQIHFSLLHTLLRAVEYETTQLTSTNCFHLALYLGNDRKSLRTFAPAGYRFFLNYSPRQIPRQIPVPICLN